MPIVMSDLLRVVVIAAVTAVLKAIVEELGNA